MSNDVLDTEGSLTRKTIIGTAWLMLWRVVTRSLGFVSTLVLARLLVPADFGLVAMATTFSAGVEALSQLGLQDALVRRQEEGFDLHHTAFTLQLGRAVATGAMIAAGAPAVAWWFAEPRLLPIVLILAGITVLNGLENVGMAEYRRAMRFDARFKVNLATRLAGFFTTIACALAWESYWALMAGIVVSNAARVAMSYHMHPFRPRLRLARWQELGRFSFWTWATAAVSLVWDRCDPFVLGPAFGPAKLGMYLLAMEIALLPVSEIIGPAADALFSAFSRAQKDGESSLHHAPEVASILVLGVAPVVLSISAASGPVVEVLLGAKWVEAWPVIAVLPWACVFQPYSFIASVSLVANGHVRWNFVANVISSLVRPALLLTTVSLTSDPIVIGAVTAGCIAAESVMYLVLLRGSGAVRLRPALGGLARVLIATALAAGAVQWSGLGWQPGAGSVGLNIVRGFMIGGLGTAVFGLAVIVLWQISGRPKGAERRLAGLVGSQLAKLGIAHWARLGHQSRS